MMRMWEHIYRLYLFNGILYRKQAQVACLCRGSFDKYGSFARTRSRRYKHTTALSI